jgi:hypothetical protein
MSQEQELKNSLKALLGFIPKQVENVKNINATIALPDAFRKEGSPLVLSSDKKIVIVGEMMKKSISTPVILATIFRDRIFIHSTIADEFATKIAQKFYLTISK